MTTRVTLYTVPDHVPLATQAFYSGLRHVGDAWDWVCRQFADPDTVNCEEWDGPGDLVTVDGEPVASVTICVDNTLN